MNDIFPLDSPDAGQLSRAGGKGVGLHALFALQLPVPPGFCIAAGAFRAALEGAGLLPLIARADELDPGDGDAVRAQAAAIREAILALRMSPGLEGEIRAQWRDGLGGAPVAVRSSATAEDLEDASFAGQQDTVLGVRDEAALLDAVRRCWASLFSDRALTYRLDRGIRSVTASMGVVVQRMVEAERAGVLFTADPSTGSRAVCTIEAVEGLGEALVSGHALPDAWRIRKATGEVLEEKLGAGRTQPLLTSAQLQELVALGARVEAGRGALQDIEWAVAEGRCWLLQARAITTLNPIPSPAPDDGRWHVYVSFGHIQVNTAPLTPFGISLVRQLVPFLRDPGTGDSGVVKEAGARMYVDATPVLAAPKLAARFNAAMQSMSPQMASRIRRARQRPELAEAARAGAAVRRIDLLRGVGRIVRRIPGVLLRSPERVRRRYLAGLDAMVAAATAEVNRETGSARLDAVDRIVRRAFEQILLPFAAPLTAMMLVGERLLRRWTRAYAPQLPEDALLRGLEGNIVTEMDLTLGDLADLARPVPALRDALTAADPVAALKAQRGAEGTEPFFAAWDDFLTRFGHRGAGEIDVGVPRWGDDPTAPLKTIAALLGNAPGSHRAQQQLAHRQAEDALAQVMTGARRGPLGFVRGPFVAKMARRLRTYLALREHHKSTVMELLEFVREESYAAGERLAAAGVLARADDVWMLRMAELREAVRALEQKPARTDTLARLRALVETRAREQARWQRWSPPPVLTSDGEAIAPAPEAEAPAGTLVGTAVSSGVVEGVVRVVQDAARSTLAPGEVLVAPFADPGWTPLFMHASALVMEVGGTMTHGSVIARELGIPAVVAVDGATQKLRSGQRVRVDGDRGWVTVLDNGAETGRAPEAAQPTRQKSGWTNRDQCGRDAWK